MINSQRWLAPSELTVKEYIRWRFSDLIPDLALNDKLLSGDMLHMIETVSKTKITSKIIGGSPIKKASLFHIIDIHWLIEIDDCPHTSFLSSNTFRCS